VSIEILNAWCAKITSLFKKYTLSHQLVFIVVEIGFCVDT
jgi:Mor family transcriptional regulator